jgi:hypothetical protein
MEYDSGSSQFGAILLEVAKMHAGKGKDYSTEDDPHSNFRRAADQLGTGAWHQAEALIAIKQARLRELYPWRTDKTATYESLRDTLLDRAVYSVIALCLFDDEAEEVDGLLN